MAKIVENSKGFKVIEVPRIEVVDKMAKYGFMERIQLQVPKFGILCIFQKH